MQIGPSSQNVAIKLAGMIILILVDIVLNSFIESSFSTSFQSFYKNNYYFLPIQMIVTAMIFIMVLVMLWQTFPLRYGLIGVLIKEFKWTFIVVVSFLLLTALERGIRLNEAVRKGDLYNDAQIFSFPFYAFLYYARYITYPIFYGFLLSFSLKVIDPSYYRPERWLK